MVIFTEVKALRSGIDTGMSVFMGRNFGFLAAKRENSLALLACF